MRRMQGGKDLICLFPHRSEVKPFLFFHTHSPHLLSLGSSPELTSPSHFFKKWGVLLQHHPRQNPHHHLHHHRHYPHCHPLFGYTRSSFAFNWQLEVVSRLICFSPVRQPPPLALLSPCSFLSRVIAG